MTARSGGGRGEGAARHPNYTTSAHGHCARPSGLDTIQPARESGLSLICDQRFGYKNSFPMHAFQHITPPMRLFGGPDSLGSLERELERLGSHRAVIFCGASLARAEWPIKRLQSAMGGRCAGVFTGVRAHSPLPSVEAGVLDLRQHEADAVVAVGGGSAIVTARAASILLAEGGDARTLCTRYDRTGGLQSPKLLARKLPHLVVPTTPTTAIVKAGSAVFDPASRQRLALFDPKTRAQSVFIHPEMIATAPRELAVSASLNTLALAIEGLMSRSGDAISDATLMHSLRLLSACLLDPGRHDDPAVRSELILAAILCGSGSDYTGAGITTVLGHAIGARCEVENGLINVITLPHALRFNGEAARSGLSKVATAFGIPHSEDEAAVGKVISRVEGILDRLRIARRLRDIGVPREALAPAAAAAMNDWFLRSNPRPVHEASELEQLLDQAW